jgi:AcrR family transcriptional regulator
VTEVAGSIGPLVPPRTLRRAERRASNLSGAATAFADAGFAATSMESIATDAGVSKLIVYRHFDSKEELYRSVVEGVAAKLAAAFAEATRDGDPAEAPARAFLGVARADPHGFALLWRHSAREPQFAEYVEQIRSLAVAYARSRLAPLLRDAAVHEWAAETIVDVLVASVLHWLDHDDGSHDEELVIRAGRSLRALVEAWSD